ncbi:MAG: plasmid pRiA4b ORF-3 family protein [Pseudonocardiaceae bacterium]
MVSHPLPTGSVVPPAITSAAVASAARQCEALRRARRLASWVGEGKRVTPKHVLRPIDVPAAAQLLAISVPPRIHTAATVPTLHRPWKTALAVGLLQIVNGQAMAGPELEQWPDTDDDTMCELWLTGLTAAFAASSSDEDEAVATSVARITLQALVTAPAPTLPVLWARAREALISEETSIADPFFSLYRRNDEALATVSDVLIGFGAAIRHGQRLDATPLGRWASQEMHARTPRPISPDLPAEELIARLADPGRNDAWRAAQPWLAGRDSLTAAREILAAATVATPAQRIAAVEVVYTLDDPAQAAWHEVSTVTNLAPHAQMALTDRSRPTAPNPAETAWLAVEHAMAALTKSGPDEALSCIDERIAGKDLESRIRAIESGGHPDTAALAEALTTFTASGAKPTSSQVYQLKISLTRMRNPIWRRVLMPATASLGLLHNVIQIVMDWDGDHLHAFSVRNDDYGDPFYSPDLKDEDRLRLSGAFTPATKTIGYVYDFGTGWRHEVTCEKVLDREVGAIYPVCVAGSGDFPIEYWADEDDGQESIPFDQDKINERLAKPPWST